MQQTFDTDIHRILICKRHCANAYLTHGVIGNLVTGRCVAFRPDEF